MTTFTFQLPTSFAALLQRREGGESSFPASMPASVAGVSLKLTPVSRKGTGGSLGPNQICWLRENITGFAEYEAAAKRVRDLFEESKARVEGASRN